MIIINATGKLKTYFLGDGTPLNVKPGELSDVTIATEQLIKSVICSGTTSEVGIIVGSAYELEICKKVSGSIPFIYQNKEEAIAKLIEGKDFTERLSTSNAVEGLQIQILKLEEERDNLKSELNEVKLKNSQLESSLEPYKEQIEELKKRCEQTNLIANEEKDAREKISIKLETSTNENKNLIDKLNQAKSSIEVLENEKSELENNINLLKEEGSKCLADNERLKKILRDIVDFYKMKETEEGSDIWRIPMESAEKDS